MIVHYGIGRGEHSFAVSKNTCLRQNVRTFSPTTGKWKERAEHDSEVAERLAADLRAEGYTAYVTPH